MMARSAVRSAKLVGDQAAEAAAHHAVDIAKRKLGERGPVWWTDGSPDLNRHDQEYLICSMAFWFESGRPASPNALNLLIWVAASSLRIRIGEAHRLVYPDPVKPLLWD